MINKIDAETKENLKILNDYISQIIEHCSKCQHCAMLHDENVCFFAYECIKNDFCYMKERKNKMEMVEKLEKFIDEQIRRAKRYQNSTQMVYNFRGIAYGALMFALESGMIEFQEGAALWDRKKPEFDKLI